jgi:Mrp family chromosome partitioning ATPase
MRGGRAKLPVLAEISGPVPGGDRAWALRRDDFERLAGARERLQGRRAVLVAGWDDRVRILALALAGAACAGGRRTVLLECDLAQPRLALDLGLAPSPGLHEYLRWEATPSQVLQPLTLAGSEASRQSEPLVCIAAGRQAADSGTLLGLQSFRHVAAKLRSAYDLVIFSGPPIGAAGGPLDAVAEQADAVLAAISPDQASGRDRRAARVAIGRLPAPALGAVVIGDS